MTENIIDFPDQNAIEVEAWEWLSRLDGDDPLSATEHAQFREWKSRSPAHQQQIEQAASVWGQMNVLTELAVPADQPDQTGQAQRLSIFASLTYWLKQTIAPNGPTLLPRGLALASVFSVAAVISLILIQSPDTNLYITQVGEQQTHQLADGSVIQLNTNTQVQVDYSGDYRKVSLIAGEAHFDVAKDTNRPFQVYAGTGRVQAVGTGFAVHLVNQALEVTVTEGRVDLATKVPQQQIEPDLSTDNALDVSSNQASSLQNSTDLPFQKIGSLDAGQSATFAQSIQSMETIEQDEIDRRLSWREGWLLFSGETLQQVVNEVTRYSDLTIEIADPELRDFTIGGQFKVGETDAMFRLLEANFNIKVSHINKNLVRLSADQ
jgi:transmembrane sensor